MHLKFQSQLNYSYVKPKQRTTHTYTITLVTFPAGLWWLLELAGYSYLTIVEWFSLWISVYHFKFGKSTTSNLISCRSHFTSCGPQKNFHQLENHNSYHTHLEDLWKIGPSNMWSFSYPQSDGGAKLGVSAAKWIIQDNLFPYGFLDNE